ETDGFIGFRPNKIPAVGAEGEAPVLAHLHMPAVLAGPRVPHMTVAVVSEGDDALAVAAHRDLADRAVAALPDQRLARRGVPAINRATDGADEDRPIRSEAQPHCPPVNLYPLLPGGGVKHASGRPARRGDGLAFRREGD